MVYHILQNERNNLLSQMKALKSKRNQLPEGEILCVKNGRYSKWFKSNGANPIYIPKSEQSLAKALVAKKYYTLQIEELSQTLNLLDKFLNSYKKRELRSDALFDSSSGYSEILKSYFQQYPNELDCWLSAKYEHNPNHKEHLIHKTISGDYVRSKSEVIIANSLFTNNIPYRYECALYLDSVQLFPDFTICHPQTKQLFYWEHFGLMDNHSYCDNTYNKLKNYANHGIIPTINLITTYETQSHPIDSELIQQIIQQYFL